MKLFSTEAHQNWHMPSFELMDAVSGQMISVEDCFGVNGLVVAFICNHCPFVKSIASRFASDMELLKEEYGINCVAVMPNDADAYPDDSFENMKEFAKRHNFNFPYLYDETQEIAKEYDAVCTPEFYGFDPSGLLVYKGRFDSSEDKLNKEAKEGVSELFLAMKVFAETGKIPVKQNPSVGCSIKWKK